MRFTLLLLTLIGINLNVNTALGIAPDALRLDGYLTDLANNPWASTNMDITVEVYSDAGFSCLVYTENHNGLNLPAGEFAISVGQGSSPSYSIGGHSGIGDVFDNALSGGCHSPTSTSKRFVRLVVYDNDTATGDTLAGPAIHSVPYSFFSYNSLQATQADGLTSGLNVDQINSAAGLYFAYQPNGTACSANEFLMWDGARWICGTPSMSIGAGAVGTAEIADGTIQTVDIADSQITDNKISDVDISKVAPPGACSGGQNLQWNGSAWICAAPGAPGANSVNSATISDGTVATADLGDNSVTSAKIVNDSILSADIQDGTIDAVDLNALSVTDAKINDVGISKITSASGYFSYTPNGISCADTEILVWNNSSTRWECGTNGGAESDPSVTSTVTDAISKWGGSSLVDSNLSDDGTLVTSSVNFRAAEYLTQDPQRAIGLSLHTAAQETTFLSSLSAGNEGYIWYNSTTDKIRVWDGSTVTDVNGGGGGSAAGGSGELQFNDGAGNFNADNRLIWNNGIGRLDLAGDQTVQNGSLRFEKDADNTVDIGIEKARSSSVEGPFIRMDRARGTLGALSAVNPGDYLSLYDTRGYDGSSYVPATQIFSVATGTPTATSVPSALEFRTADGTTAPTSRMLIGPSGNVGIGTSTPAERLSVDGSIAIGEMGTAPGATAGTGKLYIKSTDGFLYFKDRIGTETNLLGGGGGVSVSTANSVGRWNGSNLVDSNLYVSVSGEVGIGIATPSSKLEISEPSASSDQNMLRVRANSNDALLIDAEGDSAISGRLGIGTQIPPSGTPLLHVRGDSTAADDVVIEMTSGVGIFQVDKEADIYTNGSIEFASSAAPTPLGGRGFIYYNGTNFQVSENGGAFQPLSGGSTSPGGSDGNIQFNNAGGFSGDPDFHWEDTNNRLSIGAGASPLMKLHVHDSTASGATPVFRVGSSSAANAMTLTASGNLSVNSDLYSNSGGIIGGFDVLDYRPVGTACTDGSPLVWTTASGGYWECASSPGGSNPMVINADASFGTANPQILYDDTTDIGIFFDTFSGARDLNVVVNGQTHHRFNDRHAFLRAYDSQPSDFDIDDEQVVIYTDDGEDGIYIKGKDFGGDVIERRLGRARFFSIAEQFGPGTNGGRCDADGAIFAYRRFNTIDHDDNLVSNVSGTSFNIDVSGTYYCEGEAPAHTVESHKALLSVNGTPTLYGSSEFSGDGGLSVWTGTKSKIRGTITVTSGDTIRVQHYCTESNAGDDLGVNASLGGMPERYATLKCTLME